MKFTSALSVTLLAFAKLIVADSESFGLLSIRSGSSLQYASVYYYYDKDLLYVGGNAGSETLSAVVTDAGKLKFNNDETRYAVALSDGSITEGPEDDGSDGFSIKDGHLIYNNVDGFYAIPDGSAYVLSTKSGENSVGIAIRASASNGQTVPDFNPSGGNGATTTLTSSSATETETSASASTSSSEASATTSTASEKESSSSTVAIESKSATALAISQIGDGQIQATQTENGAPRAAVGMGAGIAAAVALLL